MYMNCPVWLDDDICDAWIEIDVWPAERMTLEYPGSPAGFEVTDAPCGHASLIEDEYCDTVMEYIAERELDAKEAAAERKARRDQ